PPSLRLFLFPSPGAPRALHSFPTRRSSISGMPRLRIARSRQRQVECKHGSGIEAGIDPLQLDEALQQQPGAGKQQHGQCRFRDRSEEHTSELQSRENLVCRLLLEKKKKKTI